MNTERPHEVRRFADGEQVPDGWLELTEEEFRTLDPMTPDLRATWLEENGRRSPLHELRKWLEQPGDVLDAAARNERNAFLDRPRSARPNVPTPNRRHRHQGR